MADASAFPLASGWLGANKAGERSLVQGLKGDPTCLVVIGDEAIGSYGINAICTHLGCVVPWNEAAGKFICPCHPRTPVAGPCPCAGGERPGGPQSLGRNRRP